MTEPVDPTPDTNWTHRDMMDAVGKLFAANSQAVTDGLRLVTEELARLGGAVDANTAELARLAGLLEPPVDPPPPPGAGFGATTGNLPEWTALEGLVGAMPVRRTFESGFVADFRASKAWPDVAAGRHSVWSFKIGGDYTGFNAGGWDERIRALLASIPAGHRTTIVCQHEPENDTGIVAADWRATQTRLATLVASTGRPELDVVPVLMGWTFAAASGRNPTDWFDQSMYDAGIRVVGIDEYQPADSTWQTWGQRAARFTPVIEGWGCKVAICEVGCPDRPEFPTRKVEWINDLAAWADEHGAPYVLWFNYVSGIMSSDETYLLDSSPQVTAAYAALVAD